MITIFLSPPPPLQSNKAETVAETVAEIRGKSKVST